MQDLWLPIIAIIAFIIMTLKIVLKSFTANKVEKVRREQAITNLQNIRQKVRDKHGPLIDPEVLKAQMMSEEVTCEVNQNPLKAAGSIKKFYE